MIGTQATLTATMNRMKTLKARQEKQWMSRYEMIAKNNFLRLEVRNEMRIVQHFARNLGHNKSDRTLLEAN